HATPSRPTYPFPLHFSRPAGLADQQHAGVLPLRRSRRTRLDFAAYLVSSDRTPLAAISITVTGEGSISADELYDLEFGHPHRPLGLWTAEGRWGRSPKAIESRDSIVDPHPGSSLSEGKGTTARTRLLRRRFARALYARGYQRDPEARARIEGISLDAQSRTSTGRIGRAHVL